MRMAALQGGSSGSRSSSSGRTTPSRSSQQITTPNDLVEMNPDHYRAFAQSVVAQLNGGKENAALGNVTSRWNELSSAQRQGIQSLLSKYGYQYNP